MNLLIHIPGIPPKKDGANSMWRKRNEISSLKALRVACLEAMNNSPLVLGDISLKIQIYANPKRGDLDNFITGICDGLMAAHWQTPIDFNLWEDVPEMARPGHAICFEDDIKINQIWAERLTPDENGEHYVIELEWQ